MKPALTSIASPDSMIVPLPLSLPPSAAKPAADVILFVPTVVSVIVNVSSFVTIALAISFVAASVV